LYTIVPKDKVKVKEEKKKKRNVFLSDLLMVKKTCFKKKKYLLTNVLPLRTTQFHKSLLHTTVPSALMEYVEVERPAVITSQGATISG